MMDKGLRLMRFKLSSDAKKYLESQDKPTIRRIYKHLRDATKKRQLAT